MPWHDGLEGPARDIAAEVGSPLRVRAGPGTGKTFAMMRRIARLVEEGVDPRRILVCTFTRTAAADLRREVSRLEGEEATAIRATTLHAFCFSLLARNEVLQITGRTPRPLLAFERRALLHDLNMDGGGGIRDRETRLQAFEAAWARLQSEAPGWPRGDVDRRFNAALLDWLRFHGAMLIGELVPEALRYLQNNPAAPEHRAFNHVLIDEYQDLNVAEQTLTGEVSRGADLSIVGDEDQSIYGFKFAHPEGITEFHERNQGTVDYSLDECRRCPTRIVEVANALIANNRRANRLLVPRTANGVGELHIVQWPSTNAEAKGLAEFIGRRVVAGDVHPGEVLVLAPRRQLGYAIRDALATDGVPAHSFFNEEALDSESAQEAFVLLTLLVRPDDAVALRCWCGFGSADWRSPAWARLRQICRQREILPREAIVGLVSGDVCVRYGRQLRARAEALRDRLAALEGLTGRQVIDALFAADDEACAQARVLTERIEEDASPEAVLDTLRAAIAQPELPTDVEYVRVMSLHKSKGLTADLVVVVGCVEGLIPTVWAEPARDEEERVIEEQRRLFYVSITRARRTLVLSSVNAIPAEMAYRIGVRGRRAGTQVRTITSRFVQELGPTAPRPVRGQRLQGGGRP